MSTHEEEHVVQALIALCREQRVRCVVQVGADDGYEANEIGKALRCRAVAIEPDPLCAPCSRALEYHEVLIGAEDLASVPFFLHKSRGLSTKLARGEEGLETRIEMPQSRLDSFCKFHEVTPDALIIDTEGTTLDVLQGCGSLLDRVWIVYAETQTSAFREGMRSVEEVDALLRKHGMKRRFDLPAYGEGDAQGNSLWVRE